MVGLPQSRFRQTRDCAAQESPGDRVPARGFPLSGDLCFHRRDSRRRSDPPDSCCWVRMLQVLTRPFRKPPRQLDA